MSTERPASDNDINNIVSKIVNLVNHNAKILPLKLFA